MPDFDRPAFNRTIHQIKDVVRDRYSITDILGKGGVAITYRAIDLETKSSVAIKVISLRQLENWKQIELFQREAEVLAQLNHPAIPRYIDYFTLETATDKAFYLVQELAPGKSLSQLVESGWRTNEAPLKDTASHKVKDIARQVLYILIYLHSLDPPVVHRDIKPNNLIRSDDGKIYLVDFGAVQNTYYDTSMQGSTVVGTYGYMAPEQFRGKALPATDLYSLGATLLYLLTHKSPADLPQNTLKLDFRNSVDISPSFADWLDKILEPNLEDRFSTADFAFAELIIDRNKSAIAEKKKQPKLIASLGMGILALGLVTSTVYYKWFFPSRLGFYPNEICSADLITIKKYLSEGGKANIVLNERIKERKPILNCIINSSNIELEEKQKIANLLIDKGLDVNQKDKNNTTPLLLAAKDREYMWLLKLLLKNNADPNIKNNRQETPLLVTRDEEAVKLLVEHGAEVNVRDKSGNTPLLINAKHGETVELLVDRGAAVNVQDEEGNTPLLINARDGEVDIVELLLENSADPSIRNNLNETPLLAASNVEKVKLLVEHGADVDAKDIEGNTSLLINASNGKKDTVEFLLKNGADFSIKNNSNQAPLAVTRSVKIAKLLVEHGVDVNAQFEEEDIALHLYIALTSGDTELFEFLINQGVDINTKRNSGYTVLLYAMGGGEIDKIEFLIERGADINVADENGETPLLKAVLYGDRELVQYLIDRGADTRYLNYQFIKNNYDLDDAELKEIKYFLETNQF